MDKKQIVESYTGEYADRGEYHKYLDPNWSFYPIYVRKIAFIDEYMGNIPPEAKILDAGCGEGVLVNKYISQGRDIVGLDLHVCNEYVQQGDILNMPFESESFDLVLFLDVIEHLNFQDQPASLQELKRVLKKGGRLIISVPNLAHKASRRHFYKTGELMRTADIMKHPGDRPVNEYIELIKKIGFLIEQRVPIMLTLPQLYQRILTKVMGIKNYEKYIYSTKRNPDDCFLNIFVLAIE